MTVGRGLAAAARSIREGGCVRRRTIGASISVEIKGQRSNPVEHPKPCRLPMVRAPSTEPVRRLRAGRCARKVATAQRYAMRLASQAPAPPFVGRSEVIYRKICLRPTGAGGDGYLRVSVHGLRLVHQVRL